MIGNSLTDWTIGWSWSGRFARVKSRKLLSLKVTSEWTVLHYWQWSFFACEISRLWGLGGKISYFKIVFNKKIWKAFICMWSVRLNLYICVIRLSLLGFTILYTIPISGFGNVSPINRHETGQSTRNIQDKSKLVPFYCLPYLKVSWYFLQSAAFPIQISQASNIAQTWNSILKTPTAYRRKWQQSKSELQLKKFTFRMILTPVSSKMFTVFRRN